MRQITPGELLGLAADIDLEAERLRRLADDIAAVQREIEFDPQHARLFYKNLALKLHTFYTGCERIFQFVAAELNGAPPTGFDWHRRLLERMGIAWQGRPACCRLRRLKACANTWLSSTWCETSTASSWTSNALLTWWRAILRCGAGWRPI